jgi:hypothetical protein
MNRIGGNWKQYFHSLLYYIEEMFLIDWIYRNRHFNLRSAGISELVIIQFVDLNRVDELMRKPSSCPLRTRVGKDRLPG